MTNKWAPSTNHYIWEWYLGLLTADILELRFTYNVINAFQTGKKLPDIIFEIFF